MAEAFLSNPQLWRDIEADLRWSVEQSVVELKRRDGTNREWLAGHVSGLEHAANLKRRMELWQTENKRPKT